MESISATTASVGKGEDISPSQLQSKVEDSLPNNQLESSTQPIKSERDIKNEVSMPSFTKVRKTLSDVTPIRELDEDCLIWDFDNRCWAYLWRGTEVSKDAENLLWVCAQKYLKAIYFCTRQCSSTDIACYIPNSVVERVFSIESWNTKLAADQSKLHNRVLTKWVGKVVIPRWQNASGFASISQTNNKDTTARKNWLLERAKNDTYAMQRFMAPLQESLSWDWISSGSTSDDSKAHAWAIMSLAEAVDILLRHSKTRERNKQWQYSPNKTLAPDFRTLPIRLDFGCGQRLALQPENREPLRSDRKESHPSKNSKNKKALSNARVVTEDLSTSQSRELYKNKTKVELFKGGQTKDPRAGLKFIPRAGLGIVPESAGPEHDS